MIQIAKIGLLVLGLGSLVATGGALFQVLGDLRERRRLDESLEVAVLSAGVGGLMLWGVTLLP